MDGSTDAPETSSGRIVAICTIKGCFWVRMRMPDGGAWEGDLPRALPQTVQEGAGVACPAHRPTIEARCVCRRRRVDGRWETAPLPRDIPIAKDVPIEECPLCASGSAVGRQ